MKEQYSQIALVYPFGRRYQLETDYCFPRLVHHSKFVPHVEMSCCFFDESAREEVSLA